jgi:hypothetical protein
MVVTRGERQDRRAFELACQAGFDRRNVRDKMLDSEVRCSFVWVWRAGRWQMVFNQLTPVAAS